MRYITNAFSLNMLSEQNYVELACQRIDLDAAIDFVHAGCVSAVGHEDTARLFSALVGDVSANRITLELHSGDELLVGQYTGPRLEPGSVELPPGATITWWRIEIIYAIEQSEA